MPYRQTLLELLHGYLAMLSYLYDGSGPYLWVETWISNLIRCLMWHVIIHPCSNFNGGSTTPVAVKAYIFTSHCFAWMLLLIHTPIAMLV